jgi:ATP-dependent Clp protease ATP-binding subunit ClpB
VIQKHLVDRLALGLLQGDFTPGDHVRVDAAEGELRFERRRTEAPVPEEPAPAAAVS